MQHKGQSQEKEKARKAPELEYDSQNSYPEIIYAYAVSVQNRFEALMNDTGSNLIGTQ